MITIRAEVYSVLEKSFDSESVLHWYGYVYELMPGGWKRTLVTDDCRDRVKLLNQMNRDVASFRRVAGLEQLDRARSWSKIVSGPTLTDEQYKDWLKTLKKKNLVKIASSSRTGENWF